MQINVSKAVSAALDANKPVVALESTIISHGLPRPRNLQAAIEFEDLVASYGATPATIAVLDGIAHVGLEKNEVERISNEDIAKASIRDLPILTARKGSGATTVAATAYLAAKAGIKVFATGGLGGVHRGANESFDESADLSAMATNPVAIVSAGAKSVLDLSATLERLETLSVPVLGYKTNFFPSFWLSKSDLELDWRVENASEIAAVYKAQRALKQDQGILVANPIPEDQQWEKEEHDRILAEGVAAAVAQNVTGKAVTPFLLSYVVEASNGRSLEVNLDLVRNNIKLAAEIAKELAA
ncbi:MAG: pseudouridine-5'-phosphate glycosidase [Microbacteriaceae bacterium]|nr:pseudouridine-5'-phosphate glycosidase [Microbacteriaceae bacterium]